ncbi:MAG: hypothetical protein DRP65_04340 [Planctomycetota bacterium]|nr:MAG: hypothetical protein DRP65_04340 [Planctomycetota bacterium]
MLKALNSLRLFAALCAAASVVFVIVHGIQDDRQREDFLNMPGAIDQFRSGAGTTEEAMGKVSPLLKSAKAFALRINPPPPKPKKPKAPSRPQVAREPGPERPRPKAPVRAKFKVLATCRYEQQPDRSLALLDMPVKGIKWYRQGDVVGHLTIQQVKDGSVVCSDGQELFVPVSKKKTKILLKSEVAALQRPQATISTPLGVAESVIEAEKPAAPQAVPTITGVKSGTGGQAVGASPAKAKEYSAMRRRIRRLPPRKPHQQPQPEPTPEEMKETLTESIDAIKEMMAQPSPLVDDEDKAKELKIWGELLQTLEEERDQAEESSK